VQGTVTLRIKIDESGSVQSVEVLSGPALFVCNAMETVKKWKYKPTLKNGIPVTVDTVVNVIYKLADASDTRNQALLSGVSTVGAPVSGTSEPSALPRACSGTEVEKYGRPVFFPTEDGLRFGVSTPKDHLKENEELPVYIWLLNDSKDATPQMVTCCEISFLSYIQVLDFSGSPLESAFEIFQRKTRERSHDQSTTVQPCTCSGPLVSYPPVFCGVIDHGTFNRRDTAYEMPAGKYIVTEKPVRRPILQNHRRLSLPKTPSMV
jgi:TonB family protein